MAALIFIGLIVGILAYTLLNRDAMEDPWDHHDGFWRDD